MSFSQSFKAFKCRKEDIPKPPVRNKIKSSIQDNTNLNISTGKITNNEQDQTPMPISINLDLTKEPLNQKDQKIGTAFDNLKNISFSMKEI